MIRLNGIIAVATLPSFTVYPLEPTIIVMRFVELLDPEKLRKNDPFPVGGQQAATRRLFRSLVERSHLNYWKCGDPEFQTGTRFLLGVGASFSMYELHLADMLDEYLSLPSVREIRIDVFDVDDPVRSEYDNYIPGMSTAVTTPILGVWREGQFTRMLQGSDAIDFLKSFVVADLVQDQREASESI